MSGFVRYIWGDMRGKDLCLRRGGLRPPVKLAPLDENRERNFTEVVQPYGQS